jgi:hypothetical protein
MGMGTVGQQGRGHNKHELFPKLKRGQNGAITQNFYFQFYFNVLDLNIEPKLNINKIGLIKIILM